jgi:hypothetical protein
MTTVAQLTNLEEDVYNLACGQVLLGKPEAALALLESLAARGATVDPARDADFATLWGEPRFVEVAERFVSADGACAEG